MQSKGFSRVFSNTTVQKHQFFSAVYSATKRNATVPYAATWVELEIIIPSEFRQRQISCDITYMQNLKKYK